MPYADPTVYSETSPFPCDMMAKRLIFFLNAYSRGNPSVAYSVAEVIGKTQKRLHKIAEWSENEGKRADNRDLLDHARMYRLHAEWLRTKAGILTAVSV
jgi:hypothetical protein